MGWNGLVKCSTRVLGCEGAKSLAVLAWDHGCQEPRCALAVLAAWRCSCALWPRLARLQAPGPEWFFSVPSVQSPAMPAMRTTGTAPRGRVSTLVSMRPASGIKPHH